METAVVAVKGQPGHAKHQAGVHKEGCAEGRQTHSAERCARMLRSVVLNIGEPLFSVTVDIPVATAMLWKPGGWGSGDPKR